MESAAFKPKPRRKLNRAQIIDILERNVTLYKEEESFVHYLVELAIYLMEYEYDWSESVVSAPSLKLPSAPAGLASLPPGGAVSGKGDADGKSVAIGKPSAATDAVLKAIGGLAAAAAPAGKSIITAAKHPAAPGQTKPKACPYCGTEVGDQILCPSCRNLTR